MKKVIYLLTCVLFLSGVVVNAQDKIHREDTEWANLWITNVNKTDQPHILMIGNSITMRYYEGVTKALKGKAYCSRLSTSKSLGDPAYLLEVELALQNNKFDIIHFNNGLHGHDYSEKEYMRDFPKLLALFKKYAPKAKLVWATITPVRLGKDLQKMAPFNERVIIRNKYVMDYLKGVKSINIDDLYSVMIDHPDYYSRDGVHPNEKGTSALVAQVSKILLNLLSK